MDRASVFAPRAANALARDVLTLTIGTAIAQVIGLMAAPFLTRLYRPDAFGVFALYTAGVALLVPLATGRYAMAIMLPREDARAHTLLKVCIVFALVFGGLAFCALWLARPVLSQWLPVGVSYIPWIGILSAGVVIGSWYQSLSQWAIRTRAFRPMAGARVTQVGGMLAFQSAVGLGSASGAGLALGDVVGNVGGSILIAFKTLGWRARRVGRATILDIKALLVEYREFPLYTTWGGLINNLAVQSVPLLLTSYFAASVVGFYALAYRIVFAPMSLIGQAVSDVFFQRASAQWNETRDIQKLVEGLIVRLFLLAAAVSVVLLLSAPPLFAFVFGQAWVDAGRFAQVLVPVFFFNMVVSPVSPVLLVCGRQRALSMIQVLLLVAAVAPIAVGALYWQDAYRTLLLFSLAQASAFTVYFAVIWTTAKCSLKGIGTALRALGPRDLLMGWR